MRTISEEQFKEQYGERAVGRFSEINSARLGTENRREPDPNSAKADLSRGFQGAQTAFQKGLDRSAEAGQRDSFLGRTAGRLGAGFRFAGEALGSLGEGVVRALPGGTTAVDTVEDVAGAGIEAVAGNETVQKVAQTGGDQFDRLPEGVQQTVGDVGNILLGGAGIGGTLVAPGVVNNSARSFLSQGDDILKKSVQRNANTDKITSIQTLRGKIQERIKNARFDLSDIDPQTETALKRSNFDEVNKHFQMANEAAKDTRKNTPFEIVGNQAEEAFDTIKKATNKASQGKKRILDEVADQKAPPQVTQSTLQDATNRMSDKFGVSVAPDGSIEQSVGRFSKLDDSDQRLVSDYFSRLQSLGEQPTFREIDDFIDWSQSQLYKQSKTVSRLDAADEKIVSELKQITGQLNGQLKDQVGNGYAEVNARIAKLLDMQDEISRGLGADTRKGGGFVKRLFSPTGGNTRRIFEDIREVTGIDLDKQANLAKFAMDSAGDDRQKSLLQSVGAATKEAETLSITEPLSLVNFVREKADLDAQELANEIIRRTSASE